MYGRRLRRFAAWPLCRLFTRPAEGDLGDRFKAEGYLGR
jgi:hypothetical protein